MVKQQFYKGHKFDAGVDFGLYYPVTIAPHSCVKVATAFCNMNPKKNSCVITVIRSKYAHLPLYVVPCPIDTGYTGTVHLWLHNLGNEPLVLARGVDYFQFVYLKVRQWNQICGYKVLCKSKELRGSDRDTTI